jgi:hypothetical protein
VVVVVATIQVFRRRSSVLSWPRSRSQWCVKMGGSELEADSQTT